MIKKLINWIKVQLYKRKKMKEFKKYLDEYKKQDPFNYTNF